MKVVSDAAFLAKLKKIDVRIRKSFKKRILLFSTSPHSPELKNHALRNEYKGYRSINVTADWRAIYKEVQIGEDTVAYFVAVGTHKQLYGK